MTVHGYARVSRGRDNGSDTLQNQRLRLTGAGVDAAHIHQDIITGTKTGPEWSAGRYTGR